MSVDLLELRTQERNSLELKLREMRDELGAVRTAFKTEMRRVDALTNAEIEKLADQVKNLRAALDHAGLCHTCGNPKGENHGCFGRPIVAATDAPRNLRDVVLSGALGVGPHQQENWEQGLRDAMDTLGGAQRALAVLQADRENWRKERDTARAEGALATAELNAALEQLRKIADLTTGPMTWVVK